MGAIYTSPGRSRWFGEVGLFLVVSRGGVKGGNLGGFSWGADEQPLAVHLNVCEEKPLLIAGSTVFGALQRKFSL